MNSKEVSLFLGESHSLIAPSGKQAWKDSKSGDYMVKEVNGVIKKHICALAAAEHFLNPNSLDEYEIAEMLDGRAKGKVLCNPQKVMELRRIMLFSGERKVVLWRHYVSPILLRESGIDKSRYEAYHYHIVYEFNFQRAFFDAWVDDDYNGGRSHSDIQFLDLTDALVNTFIEVAAKKAFEVAEIRWKSANAKRLKDQQELGAEELLREAGLDHVVKNISEKSLVKQV